MSDILALQAIGLIATSLRRAVENGSDLQARSNMALGSMLAGLSFGVAGTSAAHAIQYPVGALTHTPHGAGVATMMPYVMAWNMPACSAEMAQIGATMGLPDQTDRQAAAEATIHAVAYLFASIGLPPTLAQLGVSADQIAGIASGAMNAERLVNNNPRTLDLSGMTDIVTAAASR